MNKNTWIIQAYIQIRNAKRAVDAEWKRAVKEHDQPNCGVEYTVLVETSWRIIQLLIKEKGLLHGLDEMVANEEKAQERIALRCLDV